MKLISFVIIKHGTTKKIDHVALVQEPKRVLVSCSPTSTDGEENEKWKNNALRLKTNFNFSFRMSMDTRVTTNHLCLTHQHKQSN
jgi:hypothetical protein